MEMTMKIPVMLSIAGSDNTGGAGIQADIKTAFAFGVYAAATITAVTSQNSRKVTRVEYVGDEILRSQLDTFFEEYTPLAVKIGMVPNARAAEIIAEILKQKEVRNIVLDPVLFATSGGSLSGDSELTAEAIARHLFPLTTLITPNLQEAEFFTGEKDGGESLVDRFDLKAALVTGGDADSDRATDIFYRPGGEPLPLSVPKINSINTHGSGCVLSSAVAACLAKGLPLLQSIREAKDFVTAGIRKGARLTVTDARGPLFLF